MWTDRTDTDGWRARLTPDILSNLVQIELAQRMGPTVQLITEWGPDGRPVISQFDTDPQVAAVSTSLWLPRGALNAIADHVEPAAVHRAEIRRLEETLAVERARVDRLLDARGV